MEAIILLPLLAHDELCQRELFRGNVVPRGKVALELLVERELHADVRDTEQRGEQTAVQALESLFARHCAQ
jgi:hypothetical protein